MRLGGIYLVVLFGLSVAACDKQPYLDREFSNSSKAYTNVFELLANYEKQTDATGQGDGVRVIRYYEKVGRYAGYTNQARTWFSLITEDELKQRIIKRINRRSGADTANPDAIVGPVRVTDGIGFYLRLGPCHFISVLKRVTGPNKADNDTGDPDFIGVFRICRGLKGTAEQFIENIGVADKAAEGRYRAIVSGTHASPYSVPSVRASR